MDRYITRWNAAKQAVLKKDVLLWQAFCLGRQILGLFCVAESVLLLSVIVWQTFIVVLILLDQ
jgi:hypothetical protein